MRYGMAIYALDNKIAADKQYHLLLQLEKTLAGFCRWALLHGKKIRPDAQTINCYSRYLQDYEHYFNQQDQPIQFKEQLELIPAGWYSRRTGTKHGVYFQP